MFYGFFSMHLVHNISKYWLWHSLPCWVPRHVVLSSLVQFVKYGCFRRHLLEWKISQWNLVQGKAPS